MSIGLIPPSEVSNYINTWIPNLKNEFDEDQMEYLLLSIEAMDDRAFKFYNKSSSSSGLEEKRRAIVGPNGEMLSS